MKLGSQNRIYIFAVGIMFLSAIIVARLFYLQIIHGPEFSREADQQYIKPTSDIFSRGSIYFEDKNDNIISAAGIKTDYILALNTSLVSDPESLWKTLSKVIMLDHDTFLVRASKVSDPYEPIARVDNATGAVVAALKLPGVNLYKENLRFYPAGRMASQVLGFVSQSKSDGTAFSGRYGIEKYYNSILKRNASDLYVNFFAEMFSNISTNVTNATSSISGDVVLTIEPNVENYLSKALDGIMQKWNPDSAAGLVMDPKSGKIIAMSALPDFDPNNFRTESNISVFLNPLVENVFEMGSIIKPLTLSAGIDAGAITPKTTYDDTGSVTLNGKTIENHDHKVMGVVDMQAVIDNSLNTGAVFVMEKLGKTRFSDYMKAFGMGEKTGIDLPNEVSGLTSNLDSNYEIDYATAAFGQGIAISPIEAARALSAVANGGTLIMPHVVDRIITESGASVSMNDLLPANNLRVLKASSSQEMTKMLVHAFDYGLLGGKYKLNKYSVAAKTGTAQMPDSHGGYSDMTLHSFFGYFPAYNPRFLILVYMTNPKNGATFSSDTLSLPFTDMVKFLINYYEIPPDRNLNSQ